MEELWHRDGFNPFESATGTTQRKPYPSTQAINNTFEVALREYRELEDLNPVSMWDLHFLRDSMMRASSTVSKDKGC